MTTVEFVLYPAVDLRRGRVVRLVRGDPRAERVYGEDPVAWALRWQAEGARWLHVVNLDGALEEGGQENRAALEAILRAVSVPVQFGGGIRSLAEVEALLALGVARVILGTLAVRNPALAAEAVERFGAERIVVALDARGGEVVVRGWQEGGGVTAVELGRQLRDLGVIRVLYTDVDRDGTLQGPAVAATVRLARETGLRVIASGGVSGPEDVAALRRHAADGVEGVVVGRALYEGRVRLGDKKTSIDNN